MEKGQAYPFTQREQTCEKPFRRPIYLLDDVGKLLEQLVAGRLWINMDSERGVQR